MKILLLSDLILGHYLEYVHHKYMEVWETVFKLKSWKLTKYAFGGKF